MKMPGRHARLSQPAGRACRRSRRTASTSPATCFVATPTGSITSSGRTDDMFVSGGENIYPADVERMLERHPDIAQAAVVPVDDEIKGQKPVAFVVLKAGHRCSEDEIKRFALANAPAYQHPRVVFFLDALPLASTNKIDRGALRRLASERRPGEADGKTAGR